MPDIAKWPSQVHNIINPNEELLIVGKFFKHGFFFCNKIVIEISIRISVWE